MKPRRSGQITELQNGAYFFYHVKWEETGGERGRCHEEVEVFKVDAVVIWATTDRGKFAEAKTLFEKDPELFNFFSYGQLDPNIIANSKTKKGE